jgi:hypothetical protein
MFGSTAEEHPMFAISLTLVVLFSTAVLLYQYWRGSLAANDGEASMTQIRPMPHEHVPSSAPPARAA